MTRLIVDLETSAQDRHHCGIVQIGAAWIGAKDPFNECFTVDCKPRPGSAIDPDSIAFNGSARWINEKWTLYDDAAVTHFARWIYESNPYINTLDLDKGQGIIMVGWNIGVFDWLILERVWKLACPAVWPFSFRSIDLHAVACADMHARGIHVPETGLTSSLVCEVYNIPAEPKPHTALGGVAFESALYDKLFLV